MSFELILPFLRPIESLILDDSVSEIMGKLMGCGGKAAIANTTGIRTLAAIAEAVPVLAERVGVFGLLDAVPAPSCRRKRIRQCAD